MNIPEFNEIVEPNDQTEAREHNLKELIELVGNPYPNKFERSDVSGEEDTITSLVNFEPIVEVVEEIGEVVAKLKERERPDPAIKEPLNEKLKALGHVRIAGRLATPPRVMGKAAFVHLSDGKNRLQIYVRKQDAKAISNDTGKVLDEEFSGFLLFGHLDHGDFVGVEGFLFLTNTGELSVHVETIQFLAKAMLPMPDKMHGIADPELRRRFRYMDLIGSSLQIEHEGLTTREIFERRAKIISSMRRYLEDHGYIEVETPMLTPKATGAAAEPFETYHKALDIPLFARIAPELYLKRLMVGGFEKVYELNRNFRNEGLSHKHNPEFTMLEFYCAYMDVNGMMDFCEEMLRESVKEASGSLTVTLTRETLIYEIFGLKPPEKSFEIRFDKKFERLSMIEAICKYWNNSVISEVSKIYNIGKISLEWLKDPENFELLYIVTKKLLGTDMFTANYYFSRKLSSLNESEKRELKEKNERFKNDYNVQQLIKPKPKIRKPAEIAKATEELFEEIAEKKLIQPTFIVDYPKMISPLSKASPENPEIAERFELFIAGIERANGFSELNDPKEQYERFVDQMKERESGDFEAMIMDEDYIKALSYGMPPAAGIGIGIDRIVMLLTNQHSIRDVILFPHMRPEKNTVVDDEEE